jgi:hypothetical protein
MLEAGTEIKAGTKAETDAETEKGTVAEAEEDRGRDCEGHPILLVELDCLCVCRHCVGVNGTR